MKFTIRVISTRFARNGVVTCGGPNDTNRPLPGDVVQYMVFDKEENWNVVPRIGETIELGRDIGGPFRVKHAHHDPLENGGARYTVICTHSSFAQAGMCECDGLNPEQVNRKLYQVLAAKRSLLVAPFIVNGFTERSHPTNEWHRILHLVGGLDENALKGV